MYSTVAELWTKTFAVFPPAILYYIGRMLFSWATTRRIKRYVRRLFTVLIVAGLFLALPQILAFGESLGLWNWYSAYFQPYFSHVSSNLSWLNWLPTLFYR